MLCLWQWDKGFSLQSKGNKLFQVQILTLDLSHCHKHNNNLFIYQGSIQICLRVKSCYVSGVTARSTNFPSQIQNLFKFWVKTQVEQSHSKRVTQPCVLITIFNIVMILGKYISKLQRLDSIQICIFLVTLVYPVDTLLK